MKHNWTKVLCSTAVAASLFTSCKPNPDTDTPFPQAVSPSVFMASQNQFVYAIDPITGVKKWECFINANIESSPVLYGGTLFVGNSSAILFKVDPNTGARSQSKLGFPAGIRTTPVGKDNFLYLTTGSDVKCIDIKPDSLEWSFTAGGNINSSPYVIDTQLVFGCDNGKVYMLDNRTGKLIWETKDYGTLFQSSPNMDPTIIHTNPDNTRDTGMVYIGAENGAMYAFRRKNGVEIYNYQTAAPIKSSPVVYGGNIIFGNDDSKLYCLENIKGQPRWITTVDDRIRSSPYLYGQTIYFGSYDKGFYSVNALDGSIKWRFTTGGLIASSPVCYKNYVYFGSYDKNGYALDTSSGKVLWKYAVNGLMDCSPSIDPNNSDGNGINSSISGASIY